MEEGARCCSGAQGEVKRRGSQATTAGKKNGLDSNSNSQTTCWVILGKLLSFSEALIPHLKCGQSNSSSPRNL